MSSVSGTAFVCLPQPSFPAAHLLSCQTMLFYFSTTASTILTPLELSIVLKENIKGFLLFLRICLKVRYVVLLKCVVSFEIHSHYLSYKKRMYLSPQKCEIHKVQKSLCSVALFYMKLFTCFQTRKCKYCHFRIASL